MEEGAMSVIITAIQAAEGDIVSDNHGSLWRREREPSFELINLGASAVPSGYGIESDDEHQVALDDLDGFGPLTLLMRDGKPVGEELPEPAPPKTVDFEWYLHGNKPYEDRENWTRQLGFAVTDEMLEKIGQPFYEVTLQCTLDTETGKVEIKGVKA
jgi:hypothetical protein